MESLCYINEISVSFCGGDMDRQWATCKVETVVFNPTRAMTIHISAI